MSDDASELDFVGSSAADRSLRVATALSAEVVVLRERLEIVERLAAEKGLFALEDVDGYQPSPQVAALFKARRASFIERVFAALRA